MTTTDITDTRSVPAPTPTDGPSMHDLVIDDMARRKAHGLEKYGVLLQAFNGRPCLVDAYQEVLDLAVYLRQAIAEQDPQSPDTALEQLTRYVADQKSGNVSLSREESGRWSAACYYGTDPEDDGTWAGIALGAGDTPGEALAQVATELGADK